MGRETRYFSESYIEARERFRTAARETNGTLASMVNERVRGPLGEELSTEVLRLGPKNVDRLVVVVSGTHGVEGFAGAGCQLGLLCSGAASALPSRVGVLMVHALNPYGFAHLRRVTEGNVDLNRNFRDHTSPPPNSSAYAEFHPLLVPSEWSGPTREAADAEFRRRLAEDQSAVQAAVSGGQYAFPEGLFYGGDRPTWSADLWRSLLDHHLKGVREVIIIDVHTGLGDYGECELISTLPEAALAFSRAVSRFGDVKSAASGTSSSAEVSGTLETPVIARTDVEATYIAAEYGVRSLSETLDALRADNWLYARGDPTAPEAAEVKAQIRNAFYGDTPAWKSQVFGTARELFEVALRD